MVGSFFVQRISYYNKYILVLISAVSYVPDFSKDHYPAYACYHLARHVPGYLSSSSQAVDYPQRDVCVNALVLCSHVSRDEYLEGMFTSILVLRGLG